MVSDPELMAEFRRGDESAFDKLVKRHQVALLNFFHRLVWDHALSEDLTQEVFLKLYTHKDDYEPRAKLTTFLFRIGRNCFIDYLRRTKQERKARSLDERSETGESLAERLAVKSEDPQAGVRRDELTEAVIAAIDGLPEEQKLVFVLSEVQGMKYQEIGETLSIPVGTVKSRMFHAMKRLREILGRTLKDVPGAWPAGGDAARSA